MSIESRIIAVVSSFGYPYQANLYTGEATTYFVFNYSIIPSNYADDEPQHVRYLVQIHFYTPPKINTVSTRASIRAAIKTAFSYPGETPAHDNVSQHYVYEIEVEDGAN